MIEMATISAAIGSLQSAADIAKGMIGLRDTAMIQGKVIELQSAILSAQGGALAAQSEQFTLIEKIRGLEKQIADLEAWNAQKDRYALNEISPGALAYVVKVSAQKGEPAHAICANCYEHGRKSILQWSESAYGTLYFKCSGCDSKFEGHNHGGGKFAMRAVND